MYENPFYSFAFQVFIINFRMLSCQKEGANLYGILFLGNAGTRPCQLFMHTYFICAKGVSFSSGVKEKKITCCGYLCSLEISLVM